MVPTLSLLVMAGCMMQAEDSLGEGTVFELAEEPVPAGAVYAADRVLVGFYETGAPSRLALGALRLDLERSLGLDRAGAYALPAGEDVEAVVMGLRDAGRYAWVEPDYQRYATANDPYRSLQWNMDAIDVEAAWAWSTGAGATVAVLDTGCTAGPYDGLANLGTGTDVVNGDSDPADDLGHGTHICGTVGAATDNAAGVVGIAYGATLMPVKVLDRFGTGTVSDIVTGLEYARTNGAAVVNLSVGSAWSSSTEAAAVLDAYNDGVFVAAAAGNSASSIDYPAAYPGAVAVGATDYGNARASYSGTGTDLDLMAPGGNATRDANGDGYVDGVLQETFDPTWAYWFWDGTSMSTPHVSAAAGLLMAEGATNAEAETYLGSTALDLGSSGWDSSYGHGLIQPGDALAAWDADSGGTDTGGSDTGGGDTGGEPPDTTAPAISGVSSSNIRGRLYEVTWTTAEDADSEVCNPSFSKCQSKASLVTSHAVKVRGFPGRPYYVLSTDAAGNTATEGPFSL